MSKENFIPLHKLCELYKVEMSFFSSLNEIGLIQITTIEESNYIHQDKINDIEKMIRMHRDLDINIEGIDIAFNLLQKIDELENEIISIKNRLKIYEN
ncbi:MAG: MerR family transcriptional regulator [Flavobacteria bacterium RIFCSPLOWO2_12_FULL_35_11]|nr:MAG: MerR family transcriptional regulator [Flavobacteria bacterium RIFCSPLOWO2_12_FULL_35_11]